MEAMDRQNLLDIALQYCGDFASAIEIARLNGLSLTDDIDPGTELALPDVADTRTVANFKSLGIAPATAIQEGDLPTGLGYLIIGESFMVN
jgi:hypothetical protein